MLQVGYGLSAQDADESRFELVEPPPVGPGLPIEGVRTDGRYAPYWTPANVRAHSLLAAAELRTGERVTLRAGGSYGVQAREEAPYWMVASMGPPGLPESIVMERRFAERSFHPLELRASLDAAFARDVRLVVRAEHQRAAFWRGTTVGAGVTWRFAEGARRRAAQR